MTEVGFIYFLLKLIEIFVLYRVGISIERIDKSNRLYWKYAFFAILAFGLIEGLRWGHMRDYNVYYFNYIGINSFKDVIEEGNPVFALIVYVLRSLGVGYQGFLVLQCSFLMFSCFFFLRDYKKHARYILPCLLIATAMNENFIRTFLGISFLLIGMSYLNRERYIKTVIYVLLSLLAHFCCGFMIPFLLLKPILGKGTIKPIYASVLIIYTTFFVSILQMSLLVSFANYISKLVAGRVDTLALDYLNSMDRIIEGEGGAALGISTADFVTKIKNLLGCIPMLWLCYKQIDEIKSGCFLYNLVIIGSILYPIFSQVELLGRFTDQLLLFSPIFIGYMVGEYKLFTIYRLKNVIAILSAVIYLYGALNRPFVMPDKEMYFIWDSNGMPVNDRY